MPDSSSNQILVMAQVANLRGRLQRCLARDETSQTPSPEPYLQPYVEALERLAATRSLPMDGINLLKRISQIWDEGSRRHLAGGELQFTDEEITILRTSVPDAIRWLEHHFPEPN